jgi:hypothetical protein
MAAGGGEPPSDVSLFLCGQGQELWNDLVPDELAEGLNALDPDRDALSISTFGESEKVPWEMLRPTDEISGRKDFLARIFATVRSPTRVQRFTDRLETRQAEVVLLNPQLEAGIEEVEEFREILNGRIQVGDNIRDKAQLSEVLERGEFSLLHVVGHNDYRNGVGAGLAFTVGPRLRPSDLNSLASDGGRWTSTRPLVFLNACGTNQSQHTYTGVTDWADKCFAAGAGAFVGSLWDLRSSAARAFASCFYRKLFEDGESLATAAHVARQDGNSTDPTSLAYTVYGNPSTRVTRVAEW